MAFLCKTKLLSVIRISQHDWYQCELVGPELGPAWGWIQRCLYGINLSQVLMPELPAVLNSPLTGVKSALILIAFGWAGSFPGSARVSLKVTNGQMLTFSLRNPTQVFKGSSFFLLWNHGRIHKSYRVLSEGDGTSWETTFEPHSSALWVTVVQPPGTQS